MKRLFLAAMFATVAGTAIAQAPKPDAAKAAAETSIPSPLIPHLQLRNSFDENGEKPAPALLMFTFPDGKAKSWLVDASLAYQFEKKDVNSNNKIVVEFHKNNLVDKEQENFALGYTGNWQLNSPSINYLLTGSIKYVRDWQDKSNSAAAIFNWSVLNLSGFRVNAPGYLDDGNRFSYFFTPVVGFEYQDVFQTKSGLLTGNILRAVGDFSVAFAFHKKGDPGNVKPTAKIISVSADYTRRYAAINSTGSGEASTFMFKAGADVYLVDVDKTQVSIGLKFNNGSNPLQGLKPQRSGQLSLNFQF